LQVPGNDLKILFLLAIDLPRLTAGAARPDRCRGART
jgi:hypothetical protein